MMQLASHDSNSDTNGIIWVKNGAIDNTISMPDMSRHKRQV